MAGARARVDAHPARGNARRPRVPACQLCLLGGFKLTLAGREVTLPLASRRVMALTAVHRRPVRRSVAAERLWPHLPSRTALGSLRSALTHLRDKHPELVDARGDTVALGHAVHVDAHEVEALVLQLIEANGSRPDLEVPVERLTSPLLPELDDDWVVIERERLQDQCLRALESYASHLASEERFARALTAVYAALAVEPLRETAACTLIEIHLAEGNRARAREAYRGFAQRLSDQLGVEPSPELRALVTPLIRVSP